MSASHTPAPVSRSLHARGRPRPPAALTQVLYKGEDPRNIRMLILFLAVLPIFFFLFHYAKSQGGSKLLARFLLRLISINIIVSCCV